MGVHIVQLTFERVAVKSEWLDDCSQGASGFVAISADLKDESREFLARALATLDLRLLEVEQPIWVETREELAAIDPHLCENVANWKDDAHWVWGTIHSYIGDGSA